MPQETMQTAASRHLYTMLLPEGNEAKSDSSRRSVNTHNLGDGPVYTQATQTR